MDTVKKKFFNLLALVKYVLESKTSIPFEERESNSPYKKPMGYDLYDDKQDRLEFDKEESSIKNEINNNVKTYHYYRGKVEDFTKSTLVLTKTKGGQHTITSQLLTMLIASIKSTGVSVVLKEGESIYKYSTGLYSTPNFFSFVRYFFKRKKLANYSTIEFSYEESFLKIDVLVYNLVVNKATNDKLRLVSFLENSIKENNGDLVFKKIEEKIDSIIRKYPLMDMIR